ncbi:hypothetical protein RZS08_64420, partial [Arthrospira platensis SPKY1]|nr:hypothetical protein [Arthrospira platensis SPKY1]
HEVDRSRSRPLPPPDLLQQPIDHRILGRQRGRALQIGSGPGDVVQVPAQEAAVVPGHREVRIQGQGARQRRHRLLRFAELDVGQGEVAPEAGAVRRQAHR